MYFTRGVIIKKQDRIENDKLVTVYTEKYGKVNILGKSVRKQSSKLASQLDLFNLIEIGFVHGKSFPVLTSVVATEEFQEFKKDFEKAKAGAHILNLINKYAAFEERDENIFNLLRDALFYLAKNDFSDLKMKFFLRHFEFKLLSFLGYRPPDGELPEFFKAKKGKAGGRALNNLEALFLSYFESIV